MPTPLHKWPTEAFDERPLCQWCGRSQSALRICKSCNTRFCSAHCEAHHSCESIDLYAEDEGILDEDASDTSWWNKHDPLALRDYNAKDNAMQAWLASHPLKSRIEEMHLGPELMAELTELNEIAFKMALRGVRIDPERRRYHHDTIATLVAKAIAQLVALTTAIEQNQRRLHRTLVGLEPFNYRSGPQTTKLFGFLGVRPLKKTPAGGPSWDEDVLIKLKGFDHPLVAAIAEQMHKIRRWEGLLKFVLRYAPDALGLLYPQWRPGGAAKTLRWVCFDPNLLNVPKPIMDLVGGKEVLRHPGLRDMFLPVAGDDFISADFCQIELFLVAVLSGAKKLLDQFASGKYIHGLMAAELFKLPASSFEKKSTALTISKGVTYALCFGAREGRLVETAHVFDKTYDLERAKRHYGNFFESYPEVHDFQRACVNNARDKGYMECPLTGQRWPVWSTRVDEQVAINKPIQSSAAKIQNDAMMRVDGALRWDKGEGIDLTYHDQLAVSGPTNPGRLVDILAEEMPKEVKIGSASWPFPVEVGAGRNWAASDSKGADTYAVELQKKARRSKVGYHRGASKKKKRS